MTGKLIHNLKRKREAAASSSSSSRSSSATPVSSPSPSFQQDAPSTSRQNGNPPNYIEFNPSNAKRRRNICDTPDSTSSETESLQNPEQQNGILLEALKKLMELENELETLLEDSDAPSNDEDDAEVSRINGHSAGYEAEALGFAMCARETLLFLQNEGIPENSLLYKALRDRLVAKTDGIPI